ncbi:hypothetical protein C7B04_16715 [Escherichia sp. 4726-5]|nr:hypothetical protein AAW06_12685 [Escherichia coli]PSZ15558.1 hypothetical protein C7B04_16715 [Escherichia sp. 4726-5]
MRQFWDNVREFWDNIHQPVLWDNTETGHVVPQCWHVVPQLKINFNKISSLHLLGQPGQQGQHPFVYIEIIFPEFQV